MDLNKSEWASWVQAVGAIIAIGTAFAISNSEAQRERKRRQDDELDEKRHQHEKGVRERARICALLETAFNHADNAIIRLTWELEPFKAEGLSVRVKGVSASKNLISSFFDKEMPYDLSLLLAEAYDLLSRGEALASAPIAGANFALMHKVYAQNGIPEISTQFNTLYERMQKISANARDELERLSAN